MGRKILIVVGMWAQAVGIAVTALSAGFWGFATGAALMGAGTAKAYPTLLAAIGDLAHPSWRATSVGIYRPVGIYRLWRDSGYAAGAIVAGVVADAPGLTWALWFIAALTAVSGLVVALRMRETLHNGRDAEMIDCVDVNFLEQQQHKAEELLIVDVRSPAEYEELHVQGAINIPLDELSEHISEVAAKAQVITVCAKGGGRSEKATGLLRDAGLPRVRSLCGGTQAWVKAREGRSRSDISAA